MLRFRHELLPTKTNPKAQLKQVLKKYCVTIPEADEGERTSPAAAASGSARPLADLKHVEGILGDDAVPSMS